MKGKKDREGEGAEICKGDRVEGRERGIEDKGGKKWKDRKTRRWRKDTRGGK